MLLKMMILLGDCYFKKSTLRLHINQNTWWMKSNNLQNVPRRFLCTLNFMTIRLQVPPVQSLLDLKVSALHHPTKGVRNWGRGGPKITWWHNSTSLTEERKCQCDGILESDGVIVRLWRLLLFGIYHLSKVYRIRLKNWKMWTMHWGSCSRVSKHTSTVPWVIFELSWVSTVSKTLKGWHVE